MKRIFGLILLIGILLLSLIPIATAIEEKIILDSWVRYDHKFTFEGANYSISTLQTGDADHPEKGRIAIRSSSGTEILDYNTCVESETYRYCFQNVTFEGDYIDIDPKGQSQPGLKIKLIQLNHEINLKIDKWFEKTDFNLYDKGDIAVTIQNTGDQILNNLTITEFIPTGFDVVSKSGTFSKLNQSALQINLNTLYPDSSWTGRYYVKANEYVSGAVYTSVDYISEEGVNKTQVSSKQTISVPEPYKFTTSTLKEEYDSSDDIDFNIKLENNENDNLYIRELDIYAPNNMIVSKKYNLDKESNNHFTYRGVLAQDDSKDFSIKLKPIYTGKYWLSYYVRFELKGKEYVVSNRIPFRVQTPGLECYFEFEEDAIFEAGSQVNFNLTLENDDDEVYYDILGVFDNPFTDDFLINKTSIYQGKKYVESFNNFIFPVSSEDKNYTLKLNASYRSVDLEHFECESQYPIEIKGKDKLIDIIISSPDQSMAIPGSSFDVSFLIENLLDESFTDVFVEHELSDDLSSTGFSRKLIDSLSGKETVEAYSTSIKIPEAFNKNYFEVILKVGASNPQYENAIVIEIPINKNITNVSSKNNTNVETITTVTQTTPSKTVSEEKIGFMDKLKNFFAGLFKSNKK